MIHLKIVLVPYGEIDLTVFGLNNKNNKLEIRIKIRITTKKCINRNSLNKGVSCVNCITY